MLADPAGEAFSGEERELLQELTNVAFGHAAAELAAALQEHVELSVPDVQVMPAVLLRYYVGAELKDQARLGVVQQAWSGELQGNALLLVPDALARDRLPEAGRILIGGCVGKLAELLGTQVSLGPVSVAVEDRRAAAARAATVAPGHAATVLRALFHVGEAAGYLFVSPAPDAVPWLRGALKRFMDQYR